MKDMERPQHLILVVDDTHYYLIKFLGWERRQPRNEPIMRGTEMYNRLITYSRDHDLKMKLKASNGSFDVARLYEESMESSKVGTWTRQESDKYPSSDITRSATITIGSLNFTLEYAPIEFEPDDIYKLYKPEPTLQGSWKLMIFTRQDFINKIKYYHDDYINTAEQIELVENYLHYYYNGESYIELNEDHVAWDNIPDHPLIVFAKKITP
jgi:hypothetical protein